MKNTVIFGGIGFIFIALCVALSHSKNEQTLQVSKEAYSLERNEGRPFYVNINFPQLKNTKNGNVDKANELLKDAAFSIREELKRN